MVVSASSTLLLTEPIQWIIRDARTSATPYSALPTELGSQLGAGHFAGS